MRSVGRKEEKERIFLISFNKSHGFPKPHISGIARKFFILSIALVDVIKLIVLPIIGCLPDATSFVPKNLLKTTILWTAGSIVSQMPLGNQTGLVTSIGKVIGDSHFIVVQITPPTTGAVRTGAGGIPSRQQSCPCGRAKRTHMIISQADGLGM